MHLIKINELKPGMVIASDVFNPYTNKVLLCSGMELTYKRIELLQENGVMGVRVRDEEYNLIFDDSCLSNELQNKTLDQLRTIEVRNGVIITDKTLDSAIAIVDQICASSNVSFEMMARMTEKNEYRHALNVCEFSLAIGKSMRMSRNELIDLACASLLHDFGKNCEDPQILNQLSIEQMAMYSNSFKNADSMKYDYVFHPIYGACLVDNMVSDIVKYSILYHQKNDNNTGFPFGVKIDESRSKGYDRIIHICDLYDNLLTGSKMYGRDDQKITSPVEAYQALFKEVLNKRITIENYYAFVNAIPIYPKGITVKLSDGTIGVVYFNLKENALYPKIVTPDGVAMNLAEEKYQSNPIVDSYWDEILSERIKR